MSEDMIDRYKQAQKAVDAVENENKMTDQEKLKKIKKEALLTGTERILIWEQYKKEYPDPELASGGDFAFINRLLKAQIEKFLSHEEMMEKAIFRAGIKEVVGWIKTYNDFTRLNICCEKHGVLLTEKEWQSQLKEWGIDE